MGPGRGEERAVIDAPAGRRGDRLLGELPPHARVRPQQHPVTPPTALYVPARRAHARRAIGAAASHNNQYLGMTDEGDDGPRHAPVFGTSVLLTQAERGRPRRRSGRSGDELGGEDGLRQPRAPAGPSGSPAWSLPERIALDWVVSVADGSSASVNDGSTRRSQDACTIGESLSTTKKARVSWFSCPGDSRS